MIVQMMKYDFVLFSGQHKDFLEKLQDMGLVDVTITGWEATDGDRAVMSSIEQHKKAVAQLAQLAKDEPQAVDSAKAFETGAEAFDAYVESSKAIESLNGQISKAWKEVEELKVWGEFSAKDLESVAQTGVSIHYFTCYSKEFDRNVAKWREQYIVEPINDDGLTTHFVVITESSDAVEINAQELKAPTETSTEREVQAIELERELTGYQATINKCAKSIALIELDGEKLQENLQLSKVVATSHVDADGALVILEGWATRETAEKVDAVLEQYPNMIYIKNKPTPDDNTPVLLKNNGFAKLFEFIGNFYALPKYGSMDLTPYFAPFYMLFFGFCLADAGYGLVLMLGGLFLLFKGGENMKGLAKLTMLCAAATIGFGFWVGSFFGIALSEQTAFASMRGFFLSTDNLFTLAIGVGIVQILFGMTLKIIATTQQFGFKYALSTLGWMLVLVSSLATFTLPYAGVETFTMESLPYKICVGVGLAMMLLLNTPGRNPILNIGPGLWNTYNDVTGILGDILSYIRLFAIGLSGGILALVFNDLAMGLSPDIPVIKQIVVVLILILGHGINLFMSSLSSFVHPMRLTFVEFYKNAGFEAGQRAFTPLKKSK